MAAGALTVLLWLSLPVQINGQTLSSYVYELVPGFVVASAVTFLVSLLTQAKPDIVEAHERVSQKLNEYA